MLEDDAERVQRFTATLQQVAPDLRLVVWWNARTMVRELEEYLPRARLISLDHDLDPPDPTCFDDPGHGLEVARFLAARAPVCPVIVHSSNRERSTWMMGEFELGGWRSCRVAPLGDDWIEQDWRVAVRRLLRKASNRRGGPEGGRYDQRG
jgi:hypothetical protein